MAQIFIEPLKGNRAHVRIGYGHMAPKAFEECLQKFKFACEALGLRKEYSNKVWTVYTNYKSQLDELKNLLELDGLEVEVW